LCDPSVRGACHVEVRIRADAAVTGATWAAATVPPHPLNSSPACSECLCCSAS
jgi:hypothetical protein